MANRIKLIGWAVFTVMVGTTALFASLSKDVDIPATFPSPSGWKVWLSHPKNLFAIASAILAGIGAFQTIKQLKSPKTATEETAEKIISDLKEIKRKVVGELNLVTAFTELPLDSIRRLPTALIVADYGIIPYDDTLGSKKSLLAWLTNEEEATAGRLLVAPGGYGKTRLALELVTELREQGWSGGILPRAAFQQTDIRGDLDIDDQLDRLFENRGTRGALLVLDYAESRAADIERLAKGILRTAKGSQIRLLLLARTAGDWWDDLHSESRSVQLVFERDPMLEHGQSVPSFNTETFFDNAATAFAQRLNAADTDKILLDPVWRSRPFPARRLANLNHTSPLLLAFEAYLHIRGIASTRSVLAEMAREEQRHWARSLKLPPEDVGRSRHPQVEAVHRCASAVTLIQGTNAQPHAEALKVLDQLMSIALRNGPTLGTTDLQRANSLAAIKSTMERLYLSQEKDGYRFVPVLPDLLGEHICAETLANDSDLLMRFSEMGSPLDLVPFIVANRITGKTHDRRKVYVARRAMVDALVQQTSDRLVLLYDYGRYERGELIPALEESVKCLSDEAIARLLFSAGPNDPRARRLFERLLSEQVSRHIDPDNLDESIVPDDFSLKLSSDEDISGFLKFVTPDSLNHRKLNTAYLLSNAAQVTDNYEKAVEWFDHAHNVLNEAYQEDSLFAFNLAMNSLNHSRSAWEHELFDEGIRLLERAAGEIKKIPVGSEAAIVAATIVHAITASDIYVHSFADGNERAWRVCTDAISTYGHANEASQRICIEPTIRLLSNATHVASNLGDLEMAITLGESALQLGNQYGTTDLGDLNSSTPILVNVCVNLSRAYFELNNYERALELSKMSVEWARDLDAYDQKRYRFDLGKALDGLAVDHLVRADYAEAVALEEEAIALLEVSISPLQEEDLAAALINEMVCLNNLGERNKALDRLIQARVLYRRIQETGFVRFPAMLNNLKAMETMLGFQTDPTPSSRHEN